MDGKMNKDVKIGLSIGLLALIAIFCLVVLPKGHKATEPTPDPTATTGDGTGASNETADIGDPKTLPAEVPTTGTDTHATATMTGRPEETGAGAVAEGYLPGTGAASSGPVSTDMANRVNGVTAVPGAGAGVIAPMAPVPMVTTKTYTVKKGDSLASIAKSELGNANLWRKIKEANHITNEKALKIGQTLTIPVETASATVITGVSTMGTDTMMTTGTSARTYTVVSGDSPALISKKVYGTTANYQKIMDANHITNAKSLKIGAVLTIPDLASSAPTGLGTGITGGAAVITGGPATDGGVITHVVAPGETLGDISKKYYGSSMAYKKIMTANHISDASRLRVGARLVIPPKTAAATAPATTLIVPAAATTITTATTGTTVTGADTTTAPVSGTGTGVLVPAAASGVN